MASDLNESTPRKPEYTREEMREACRNNYNQALEAACGALAAVALATNRPECCDGNRADCCDNPNLLVTAHDAAVAIRALKEATGGLRNATPDECATEIQRAEVVDLRASVIAFGAPWAADYARVWGYPPNHLDPTHYDILKRAGARMDDFVRGEEFLPEAGQGR